MGDKFLGQLAALKQKYTVPKFWIMLEKEFKDDKDKLVSSVCKYDSANGALSYCGTICLQMNEEAILKPTTAGSSTPTTSPKSVLRMTSRESTTLTYSSF